MGGDTKRRTRWIYTDRHPPRFTFPGLDRSSSRALPAAPFRSSPGMSCMRGLAWVYLQVDRVCLSSFGASASLLHIIVVEGPQQSPGYIEFDAVNCIIPTALPVQELPCPDGGLEAGPRPRCGMHGGDETGRTDPAVGVWRDVHVMHGVVNGMCMWTPLSVCWERCMSCIVLFNGMCMRTPL